MKGRKMLSLAALVLCAVLAAGCSVTDVMEDVAQRLSEANQQTQTQEQEQTEEMVLPGEEENTEPEPEQAQEETWEAATDSDAQNQEETQGTLREESVTGQTVTEAIAGLTPDECVTEVDGVPQLVLDCDGAREINEAVRALLEPVLQDEYASFYYECHEGAGRFLSLLIAEKYDNDVVYYTPYNLDLETGQAVSGQELLSLLGLDEEALIQTELALMGQEFEYEYMGVAEQTGEFYTQQYDRTVAYENADTDRLWFGLDGRLNFVGRIYSLAGADSYEYPMNSGYYY